MKILVIALLSVSTLAANAATIKLHSTWNLWADIKPTFEINAELGRAWVNLEIDDSPSDPDSMSEDLRVQVKGLTFDMNTQEVIFDDNGAKVVCAKVITRGRGIFRNSRIYNTANCQFNQFVETKMVDDGYYVTKKKYNVTTLEIK